jgi:HK97 family phage major capsid protein
VLTYLQRLVDERMTLTELATRAADKAATEDRDVTDTEKQSLTEWETRCKEIDSQLTQYNAQAESARAFADLTSKLETSREQPSSGLDTRRPGGQIETTSWGRAFVESEQFRNYTGHGQSARFEGAGYLDLSERAAITTANLAIPHFVLPPVEYRTSAPLLEVCGHVTVSSGVVDWVEVGGDPLAAVVAEGAVKPEAAFTVTPKTATLDTIAHWVQITRQALEDAAYIQSLVESKLRRGLLNKAESDMAAAIDGSTAVQTAGATAAQGGLLGAIRVGIGKVQAAGFTPNAVALNPADYAALDMQVLTYTDAGPQAQATFWGMKPVAAAAIPAGKAYVGDFQAGATLFDRGVTNVFLSDSHAALFISNILVILAEARLKSAVTEPLALCECTVLP